MSQAQTTLVGYFLGYQGLEKEPELFVSKPPHWKFLSARKSNAVPLEGINFALVYRGSMGREE